MEPRNIGVMLWAHGRIVCRFLPENQATFVGNISIYKRWVSFWTRLTEEKTIQVRDREPVPVRDPESLDAIKATADGNYFLYSGGHLLNGAARGDVNEALEFLFATLVATARKQGSETPKETLDDSCDKLFSESGLANREDFVKNYQVAIPDVKMPIKFDYAIGNGKPNAVFQKVRLSGQQSVTSAAFLFEHIGKTLPREKLGALINADEEYEIDGETSDAIGMINERAIVVNIANREQAIRKALGIVGPVLRLDSEL